MRERSLVDGKPVNWAAGMHHYCRRWEEDRGDAFAEWGEVTYFFEADENGDPIRQLEVYVGGQVLAYDRSHLDDEFGGLADQPLDLEDFEPFRISATEFETQWTTAKPMNRQAESKAESDE